LRLAICEGRFWEGWSTRNKKMRESHWQPNPGVAINTDKNLTQRRKERRGPQRGKAATKEDGGWKIEDGGGWLGCIYDLRFTRCWACGTWGKAATKVAGRRALW
jgi:hypothetical protein